MGVAAIAPLALEMAPSAAALAPGSAAATSMPAGAASAGGGGGGMGMADPVSMGLDLADKGVSLADKIDQIMMRHKNYKESVRQFDKTFDENVRQFGLEYALRDYATREGISLQKAQQLFQAEQLGMSKQGLAENIKTSALGRNIQATEFKWAKEDRAKKQAMAKAMQKGLVTGLLGGKNG